ncbi:hypothetical protein DI392_18510 [Vibrio albus]|uniref:Lysoplasmalogenase n=1 Tax=Vibrio albus TaxID=2200953 RepID=A0A2U3B577_9VIBR|nr:lysoplasmalogenase family protein [Vibrio albus]PWI31874.1 hypothetical protein DI392_18510 [Vibrio albus]
MFVWLAVGASGGVCLCATQMEKKRLAVFFKLLTMVLLVMTLFHHSGGELLLTEQWVLAGLAFSLAGNLFFLLSNRFYELAVLSFVVVSICYGKASWLQLSGPLSYWIPSMLYAALVILLFIGLPSLSGILWSVVTLGAGMVQMTWAAAEVWMHQSSPASLLGFTGAFLLLTCCIGHAFKHKGLPAKNGNLVLNSTYLISQALITASVLY